MSYLPFVSGLSAESKAALMALGSTREVTAGTAIALEGDVGNRVWVIHSGVVKVSVLHRDGLAVVIALRGPGDLIGELALIDDEPRSATATALLDAQVQVLTEGEFHSFLLDDPHAAVALRRNLAARLRESDALRLGQAAEDVLQRLARCLVDLARAHGHRHDGVVVIDLPLTQLDLAGMVGASRDAVAKSLQTWRDGGLIRTSRRRIELLDLDTLVRRHRL